MRGTLGRGLLCAGELVAEPADRVAGGVPGARCWPCGTLADEAILMTDLDRLSEVGEQVRGVRDRDSADRGRVLEVCPPTLLSEQLVQV